MEQGGSQKQWYLRGPGGEREGPYRIGELRELYSDGEIDQTTKVWEPVLEDWEPLWRVDEIINQISQTPSSTEATRSADYAGPQQGRAASGGGGGASGTPARQTASGGVESAAGYAGGDYATHQPRSTGGQVGGYPPEINQLSWNWGAFLLYFFWGIAHRHWWVLLLLIPVLGHLAAPVFAVYYGARGHKIAWDSGRFHSAQEAIECQRRWFHWGLAIHLGVPVVVALYILMFNPY